MFPAPLEVREIAKFRCGQRLKTQIVLVYDYMVLPDDGKLKEQADSGKCKTNIAGKVAAITECETGVLR